MVVTIDFLNDLDSEQYAYQILNQWEVGDKGKNNGAVLLLVPGEGKFWLTVGYGIEEYFSSSTINSILDSELAYDFDNGAYDRAVRNTFDAIVERYDAYYNVETGVTGAQTYDDSYDAQGGYYMNWVRVILFLVVAYLIYRALRNRGGGGGYGGGGGRTNFFFFPGFFRRSPASDGRLPSRVPSSGRRRIWRRLRRWYGPRRRRRWPRRRRWQTLR